MSGDAADAADADPPGGLSLRRTCWAGPFARQGATLKLPSAVGVVAVPEGAAVSVERLREAATGLAAPGRIEARAAADGGVLVGGTVPATPGRYATRLLVTPAGDAPLAAPVAVPVHVAVGAASAWGVLCLLLGLALLGTVNLLGSEGAVAARLHDALAARADMRAFLDRHPAPERRAGDVAAMDDGFDRAVVALSTRREASVVDHRSELADAALPPAQAIAARLRADLGAQPAGRIEIDDFDDALKSLRADFAAIDEALGPLPADAAADAGLTGALDAFLGRYRARLLDNPRAWALRDAEVDLGRARLSLAAGEGEAARLQALGGAAWLRRNARRLDKALHLYRAALAGSGRMAVIERDLRASLPDLPADGRAKVSALLDQARVQLGPDAWLPEWAQANRLTNAAVTERVRVRAQQAKARLTDRLAALDMADDYDDTNRLMAQFQQDPDKSEPTKRAHLLQVVDLWAAHVATVTDAARRAPMEQRLAALRGALTDGALADAGPLLRALIDEWTAWSVARLQDAANRSIHPACVEWAADSERDLAAAEAGLRDLPAGPRTAEWTSRLDAERIALQRHAPDPQVVAGDCLAEMSPIREASIALSGEVFSEGLNDAPLPLRTRLRLARESGVDSAVAEAERARDAPRLLDLVVATGEGGRVVGDKLLFRLGNLDDSWGAGAHVEVNYGDGSPPQLTDVEALRQERPGKTLEHAYAEPLTRHATARVTSGPRDELVGEAAADVLIAPSPVGAAERLADTFLNLRFGLALAIASVVYSWRYHSGNQVFGARSYDYVEAFALGFAVDAAVAGLPEKIAELAPRFG